VDQKSRNRRRESSEDSCGATVSEGESSGLEVFISFLKRTSQCAGVLTCYLVNCREHRGAELPGPASPGRSRPHRVLLGSPKDPLTIVLSVLLLTLVALPASLIPAIRVSRLDPMNALREE
jgi:hypothetical protein